MEKPLAIDLKTLKQGAHVLRALNHPLRQSIIKYLHKEEKVNVTTLYKKLRLEQAVASQQLRILREARFVNTERAGKEIYYSLNYERFADVDQITKSIVR
jgi:DNA-binding transcriptional ArsR family regulator